MMPPLKLRENFLECARIVRRAWCQRAPAVDKDGNACGPREERAVAFCAIGAIQRICGTMSDEGHEMREALREVIGMTIAPWNDGCETAEQVASAFEEAARRAVRIRP
jgi:hypothetical protein